MRNNPSHLISDHPWYLIKFFIPDPWYLFTLVCHQQEFCQVSWIIVLFTMMHPLWNILTPTLLLDYKCPLTLAVFWIELSSVLRSLPAKAVFLSKTNFYCFIYCLAMAFLWQYICRDLDKMHHWTLGLLTQAATVNTLEGFVFIPVCLFRVHWWVQILNRCPRWQPADSFWFLRFWEYSRSWTRAWGLFICEGPTRL